VKVVIGEYICKLSVLKVESQNIVNVDRSSYRLIWEEGITFQMISTVDIDHLIGK
jgi:hypothetical protein